MYDIDRLSKIGICTSPCSIQNKLLSWEEHLDSEILSLKEKWTNGDKQKYQLIGDNWDKNIVPSYRTSQCKTLSLHLFHIIAVVDRIIPTPRHEAGKKTFYQWFHTIPERTRNFNPGINFSDCNISCLEFRTDQQSHGWPISNAFAAWSQR